MYKVIGVRASSFQPKDANQTIEGLTLYCAFQDEKIRGFGTERLFVTYPKFVNQVIPNPDDQIRVSYNKYGKVESVEVLPSGK